MVSKRLLGLWKEYLWTARALPENSRRREIRIARFYVKNPEKQEPARVASLRYALRNLEKTIQLIKYRNMKRRYELPEDAGAVHVRMLWEHEDHDEDRARSSSGVDYSGDTNR